MKQAVYNVIAAMLLMSMAACSNPENLCVDPQTPSASVDTLTYWERVSLLDNYQLSESAVLKSVEKFSELASPKPSRSTERKFDLKIISKQNVCLGGVSRCSENQKQDSIPIYYVQMDKDDKHGYALVSGDIRTARILAFVPNATSEKTYEQYQIISLLKEASIHACLKQAYFFNTIKASLENTAKNVTLGSQRGYMYSGMKGTSLGGGTTGRQCDIYKYGDHQIKDENVDINFTMKYVRGSWAGESYHPELFTAVDNIFVSLKKADTNLEKIKAFYALGEIQRKLDNSTLGVTEEPTSLGGKTYIRKWVGAGNGKGLEEVQRAGDYIIIRSERQAEGEETPRYYYGLIQVMMFEYDDAQTFVEKDGLRFIDPEKAKDLFMKPVYLDIKTQCEIAE